MSAVASASASASAVVATDAAADAAAAAAADAPQKKKKHWDPLESNPQAINTYMGKLGYGGPAQWVELFSTEEWAQGMVPGPHHAVLLNFPITAAVRADEEKEEAGIEAGGQEIPEGVFFTNQTVGNACGTVGLIHAVGNNQPALACGAWFADFFNQCEGKTPMERASILEDSDELDEAHAEAAAADDSNSSAVDANLNNHFITFAHKGGFLLEFDGRKPWPVNHGATTSETLLADACKLIQKRFFARDEGGQFAMTVLSGAVA
jgi:ubiquitin carboxyl-terminal hydrolase L3